MEQDRTNIDAIKAKVDLGTIVEMYVDPTKVTPDRSWYACPFHQETQASLSVVHEEGFFYCFGCQATGDVLDFYGRINGLNFPDTVADLTAMGLVRPNRKTVSIKNKKQSFKKNENAKDFHFLISMLTEFHAALQKELLENITPHAKSAREYLKSRDIPLEFAEEIGMGYHPKNDILLFNLLKAHFDTLETAKTEGIRMGALGSTGRALFQGRITLPYQTIWGQTFGINGRSIVDRKNIAKYKNPTNNTLFEKDESLLGLQYLDVPAIQNEAGLSIVEGAYDLFGFLAQGSKTALATTSALLDYSHAALLDELQPSRINIMTDGDSAGMLAAMRHALVLQNIRNFNTYLGNEDATPVYIVPIPDEKDPFDLFYTDKVPTEEYILEHGVRPIEFYESLPEELQERAQKEIFCRSRNQEQWSYEIKKAQILLGKEDVKLDRKPKPYDIESTERDFTGFMIQHPDVYAYKRSQEYKDLVEIHEQIELDDSYNPEERPNMDLW